jgi:hypothetical protein
MPVSPDLKSTRRGRPPTGKAQSAAERMRRYRSRQRAAGIRAVVRMEGSAKGLSAGALQHRVIDARSLAMHCLAATKIDRDRALLKKVRETLSRWRARYAGEIPPALEEWQIILDRPWPEIAALATDPGQGPTRLRQSSPLSSVLTAKERQRIYDAFRS